MRCRRMLDVHVSFRRQILVLSQVRPAASRASANGQVSRQSQADSSEFVHANKTMQSCCSILVKACFWQGSRPSRDLAAARSAPALAASPCTEARGQAFKQTGSQLLHVASSLSRSHSGSAGKKEKQTQAQGQRLLAALLTLCIGVSVAGNEPHESTFRLDMEEA